LAGLAVEEMHASIAALADHRNVVVIAPSERCGEI
jgi:hypothetical protein